MKINIAFGLSSLVLGLMVSSPSVAEENSELIIENFIGTINWTNNDSGIRITDQKNEEGLMIYEDHRFIIDGGADLEDGTNCKGYYGSYNISLFGRKSQDGKFGGYEDLEDYPSLDLSLPENTALTIRNSILFTEGTPNIVRADLYLDYCGNVTLGDVKGAVNLEGNGSADLVMGNAQALSASLRGSGDIEAKSVGSLTVSGRGSGDIDIVEAGTAEIDLSGSGDLEVGDILEYTYIDKSGSGDVDIRNLSGRFKYDSSGSGDLSIDDLISDQVTLRVSGSGDVDIDDGKISDLSARASGSVTMDIDATVENADLRASGSSDIYIEEVTGGLQKQDSGSADIVISNRR